MAVTKALSRAYLPTLDVAEMKAFDLSVSRERQEDRERTFTELRGLYTVIINGLLDTKNETPVSIRDYWTSHGELSVMNGVIFKSTCELTISLRTKSFPDNLLSFLLHMRGTYFRVYIGVVCTPPPPQMDKLAKRKPNWTNAEIEVLVQAVTDNIKLVKGKFTPSITNEVKNRCWAEITSHATAEANIVGTISKSSLEGVPGGVDTSAPSQSLIMEKETSYVYEASPASITQMKHSIPDHLSRRLK
ncbi:uncharacterized protein LOC133205066 [Saccostrea echinata]|uniref:uncharacterized protein LOC133205066 n=1 Tax=Saccostrea echinata TaxID=191078 RepID=UPI002A83FCA2|nr:uncharacterized protein LOC133205066 [Saccostrea echinata]